MLLLPFQSFLLLLLPPLLFLFQSLLLLLFTIGPPEPQTPQDNLHTQQILTTLTTQTNQLKRSTITRNRLLESLLGLLQLILGTFETEETKYHAKTDADNWDDDAGGYFRGGGIGGGGARGG